MKIMFNGLDLLLELSNSRYEHKAHEVLCFAKYHNLTLYLYIALANNIISYS
jgi:hypothetical protein